MSRSLSRIRNLVSEIEEIHRLGQQGGKAALTRTASLKAEPAPTPPKVETRVAAPEPVLKSVPAPDPIIEPVVTAAEPRSVPEESDPFEELANIVDLDEHRDIFNDDSLTPRAAKLYMRLSGAVALSLQIEEAGETVELKQIGDLLEIRFADGKAFHLPLKTVA